MQFDTVLTNIVAGETFYFHNPFNFDLYINRALTTTGEFDILPDSFTVQANDSFPVSIKFSSNQNLTFRDFLVFNVKELNYPVINFVNGTAKYPDTLYSFTQGLIDEQLKSALKNFT